MFPYHLKILASYEKKKDKKKPKAVSLPNINETDKKKEIDEKR